MFNSKKRNLEFRTCFSSFDKRWMTFDFPGDESSTFSKNNGTYNRHVHIYHRKRS